MKSTEATGQPEGLVTATGTTTVAVPRVILKPRRALPFFARHPWVFAGAIADIRSDGATIEAGTEVAVHTDRGEFIARGLLNPESNIRVRLYRWDDQPLDEEFWRQRVEIALRMRDGLFAESPDAVRLVYSEADGLSGLIVDQYRDWMLLLFTSQALYTRRQAIIDVLSEKLKPRGMWLRTERGLREAEGLNAEDGLVCGDAPERPLFVSENGLRFGVDVAEGQKTGFYLDQRENRAAVARYVKGHRVLDAFCYTGGFSITAARLGEARETLGLDSSASAIQAARANAELNDVATRCRFEQADVKQRLPELVAAGEKFDTVILDPPKMARTRSGIDRALKAYLRMNLNAVALLPPGGLLVTACCSGLIKREQFEQMIGAVAQEARRPIRIVETRSQACDHPVSASCPETRYLKLLICRVE